MYIWHGVHMFSSGIGYATIKHLARRGAKVYMAARNESKVSCSISPWKYVLIVVSYQQATAAIANLKVDGLGPSNGQVVFLQLDLNDPRNAKRAAEEFLSKETRLDILGELFSLPFHE